jgi:diadenosine tetraphosphate (Ap4A) HIT family hydrolase
MLLDRDEALAQLEREREQSEAFDGCVMCRLASETQPNEWIAESEHGVVTLDGYGATRGHLLVIARRHVERPSELSWPVFCDLQRLVWQASRVLESELRPARVYLASLGASQPLPMSFPHHHVHVVPVYETDERARPAHVFSWSAGVVRYEDGEADELRARLRGAWERGV